MPWKILSLLDARNKLVEALLARRQPVGLICRRFGISPKTAYKWLERFRQQGRAGLTDRSRRPHRTPRKLRERWLKPLLAWRRRRPYWGANKLRPQLRKDHPRARLPTVRTLQRWLTQEGVARPRRRRARRGPAVPHPGLTVATRPNQVWTVDFKGWFRTADAIRQEPLTVRDLFSRFGLAVCLLPNQDDRPVRQAMTRLFRARGLPEAIRVDNGSPFAGIGALGLSRLSVWWLRMGIRVEFTRKARPGDNAAHEQFHHCYQQEVVNQGGANRRALNQRSRRWLKQYNYERPHDALKGRTPAQVYRPSRRPFPESLPTLKYSHRWKVRRVRNRGCIKWQGRRRHIGRAFVGQTIGLKPLDPGRYEVYLGKQLIGELHDRDSTGLRPAKWKRISSPKV